MATKARSMGLRSASLWKLAVSSWIGFAVISIPVAIVAAVLNLFGFEGMIETLRGYPGGGSDALLRNLLSGVFFPLVVGTPLAISVWIGGRVHPLFFRKKKPVLAEPHDDMVPVEMMRPSVRDIVWQLSFLQCLKDLTIGFFWTMEVVVLPTAIILKLAGVFHRPILNMILSSLGFPIVAGILALMFGPILMLGFWLIRGVSKLTARRAPVAA